MNKIELQKNVLDLRHQFELQKINASLTMITIGVIGFIATFVWYANLLLVGIALSLIIVVISLVIYSKTKKEIDKILEDIYKLSK